MAVHGRRWDESQQRAWCALSLMLLSGPAGDSRGSGGQWHVGEVDTRGDREITKEEGLKPSI